MSLLDEISILWRLTEMFADDVKHGSEWELESLNEQMKTLYSQTSKEVNKSKNELLTAINKLNKQREQIGISTLATFSNTISRVKNIEFDDVKCDVSSLKKLVEDIAVHPVTHQEGLPDALIRMHISSPLAWMVKEMKLYDEIVDAKCSLGRLEEACAEARKQCAQAKGACRFLNSTYKTIETLDKFAIQFNLLLEKIIEENGTEYSTYSTETRKQFRTIYNIEMALNYFVTESIFDSSGSIRKEFQKYISGIDIDEARTEVYINQQSFYLKNDSREPNKKSYSNLHFEQDELKEGRRIQSLYAEVKGKNVRISKESRVNSVVDFCESKHFIFYAVMDHIEGFEVATDYRKNDNKYFFVHFGKRCRNISSYNLNSNHEDNKANIESAPDPYSDKADIYRFNKDNGQINRIISGIHLAYKKQRCNRCFDANDSYRFDSRMKALRCLHCSDDKLFIESKFGLFCTGFDGNYRDKLIIENKINSFGTIDIAWINHNKMFFIGSQSYTNSEKKTLLCYPLYMLKIQEQEIQQVSSNISFVYNIGDSRILYVNHPKESKKQTGEMYCMDLESEERIAIATVNGNPYYDGHRVVEIVSVMGDEVIYTNQGEIRTVKLNG